jgi:hypothetical protein
MDIRVEETSEKFKMNDDFSSSSSSGEVLIDRKGKGKALIV